jgi:acyl-coenzyme A thioesterase PaaI-like protein
LSHAPLAARITEALEAAAAREAATMLVSITIDMLAPAREAAAITPQLVRKTRTLAFMRVEAHSDDGALIATASSVHKIQG